MIENLGYKKQDKYFEQLQEHKYACKCGHKVFIPHDLHRRLCTWCGRFVYKCKKDEFMDKLGRFINE